MSLDYDVSLYDPIYGALGVEASITPKQTGIAVTGLTAIDKTSGLAVDLSGVGIQTIMPAATLRMSELIAADLAADDLDEGAITLNSKSWKIRSHQLKPSPAGENAGEVYLLLSENP